MTKRKNTLEVWYDRALWFYGAGNLQRGMVAHQKVKALSPGGFHDSLLNGIASFITSEYEEALRFLDQAIALNPNDSFAYAYKGTVLVTVRQDKAAWKALEQSLRLNPENVLALAEKSSLALGLDRYEEALACANKALAKGHAKRAVLLFVKTTALFHLSRYEEALAAALEAIRFPPYNALVHTIIAEILCRLEHFSEALVAYEQALRVSLHSAYSWSNFGAILLRQGFASDALLAYERALQIGGEDAATFNGKGIALMELRLLPEAQAAFDRALLLAPGKEEILHNRNLVLQALQEHEPIAPEQHRIGEAPQAARTKIQRWILAFWSTVQHSLRYVLATTQGFILLLRRREGILTVGIVMLLLLWLGGPTILYILGSVLPPLLAGAIMALYPAFWLWWWQRHRPGFHPRILRALREGTPLPAYWPSPAWLPPSTRKRTARSGGTEHTSSTT